MPMKMKEALAIMSDNPNGTFQWMEQLLSLLANLGVDGIHRDLKPLEVIKIVNNLDKPLYEMVMGVKVVFSDIPINQRDVKVPFIPETNEYKSKFSNYIYYVFSAVLVVVGLVATLTLNNEQLDSETKSQLLNFIVEVIRVFLPS